MRRLALGIVAFAGTVGICGIASAGTVNEYVRVYGSGAIGDSDTYYFKTYTNELHHWACGTTPSGGEKNCYSYDGGPIAIDEVRVHIYPDDGTQFSYNNWWFWEQFDGEWVVEDYIKKYVADGGFIDTSTRLLEGYWGYRDGHYTYRGEASGIGDPHLQYRTFCPDMYKEAPRGVLIPIYEPMQYPLLAVSYIYPSAPSKEFQRYFYKRGLLKD